MCKQLIDPDEYWASVEEQEDEEREDEEYTFLDYLEFLSYDYFRDPEAEKAGVFSGLDRFIIKN